MALYVPILPARQGELMALEHVPARDVAAMLPVLRVAPDADTLLLFERVRDAVPADMRLAVDLHPLHDQTVGERRTTLHLFEEFTAWGLPTLPVIHLDDSIERLTDFAEAAAANRVGALVRLRSLLEPGSVEIAHQSLGQIRRVTGLGAGDCDLLIDLGLLTSEDAIARVQAVVDWAGLTPWRSVSVACGSLPDDLSGLPTGRASSFRRLEATFWSRIAAAGLGFADYGVQSPGARRRAFTRQPLPNLRYTTDEAWHIYRWQRRTASNEHGIYPLSRALAAADHFAGRDFSWGDEQISRRALNTAHAGTPSDWIAWATSHHLAHVRAWLSTGVRVPRQRPSLDAQLLDLPEA